MPTSDPAEAGSEIQMLADQGSVPGPEETPAPAPAPAAKAAERDYVVLLAVDDVPEGSAARWAELGVVKDCANRTAAITAAEEDYGLQADARVHLVPSRFWKEITGKAAPPKPPEIRWQGV